MKYVPGAALALMLALAGGAGITLGLKHPAPERTAARRELALLTSLPLMFGEQFGLGGGGSQALRRLARDYRVVPVPLADRASLTGQTLLLMAHPRAQPADVLVELDAWVRRGGGVLLLADPRLDWPSSRPLGDALRPPPDFADSGLLAHWGLTLTGPVEDGPETVRVHGIEVVTASRGALVSNGPCQVEARGLIARCRIGHGFATVIADADFLDAGSLAARGGSSGPNLDLLSDELKRLEKA